MNNGSNILSRDFYQRQDVVRISRDLLGCVLCTQFDGVKTCGIITETEAYCGRGDKACHANDGTRTQRTEVMYGPPGHSYIYLCYGIHHLFNVVTNRKGLADAVLIRAIYPITGIETMRKRRGGIKDKNLTNGPGKLSRALSIHTSMSGCLLSEPPIWIEERRSNINDTNINSSTRVGVDYAGEDAGKKWRFFVNLHS